MAFVEKHAEKRAGAWFTEGGGVGSLPRRSPDLEHVVVRRHRVLRELIGRRHMALDILPIFQVFVVILLLFGFLTQASL